MKKPPKTPKPKRVHQKPKAGNSDASYRRLKTTYYRPKAAAAPPQPAPAADKKQRAFRWRYVIIPLLLVVFVPLIIVTGWSLHNFASASSKLFGSSNVLGVFPSTPLKQDNGRVNILLVGYSVDNPGHGGADLTDSILIMSLDQQDAKKSYMLSVPRDLYVDVPGRGDAKINEAFQAGELAGFREPGYPPGGIGLLRKIVSENLGVELHYHALVNYGAVRDVVDALGGITVDVQSPDERGLYDPNFQEFEGGPLLLKNGPQTVDGVVALQLTRARGATSGSYGFPQSDFNRTQNQQLVVGAILRELNWTLVLDPRTNGKIFQAVGENVVTDIQLPELIPLYRLLLRTPADKLASYTLRELNGRNYLVSYTNARSQDALIPAAGMHNFSEIQAALQRLNQ